MRLATLCIAAVLAAGHPAWGQQPGKDGDPTPRRSLDPIDAAKVKQFEAKRWLDFGARRHHEIYLGDPRKTAPERLRTIIRHPIAKI